MTMSDRAEIEARLAKRREMVEFAVGVWMRTPGWTQLPAIQESLGHEVRNSAERLAAERYPLPRRLRERHWAGTTFVFRYDPEAKRFEYREVGSLDNWNCGRDVHVWNLHPDLIDLLADLKDRPFEDDQ